VILVGLPGAGKSTVGRRVARRLHRPFLDLDREIERREGARVNEIFATRGESYFRALELELTRELASQDGMLLAPGGGWMGNEGAPALLRPPGRIIYLKVAPDVALRRMGRSRVVRPLLEVPNPLRELKRLLEIRGPMYESADHVVDMQLLRPQEVIATVAQLATTVWNGYL
jgi:shikimate kinase